MNRFTASVVTANKEVVVGSSDFQLLTSAAQSALEFGSGKDDYIDLGQFMTQIAQKASDAGLRTAALDVSRALDDAVLWEQGTVTGASGLSVYLPAGNEAVLPTYAQDNAALMRAVPLWDEFLGVI